MSQPETILERTDRMLGVIASQGAKVSPAQRSTRDLSSLWSSGLGGSLLFSVGEEPADASAESEAQSIITRHLERQKHRSAAMAMSEMVDFQRTLQMRSKVISAIEMLIRG